MVSMAYMWCRKKGEILLCHDVSFLMLVKIFSCNNFQGNVQTLGGSFHFHMRLKFGEEFKLELSINKVCYDGLIEKYPSFEKIQMKKSSLRGVWGLMLEHQRKYEGEGPAYSNFNSNLLKKCNHSLYYHLNRKKQNKPYIIVCQILESNCLVKRWHNSHYKLPKTYHSSSNINYLLYPIRKLQIDVELKKQLNCCNYIYLDDSDLESVYFNHQIPS